MALAADFGPKDIRSQIQRTDIQGRHLTFIDDLSESELLNLFVTAEMLEPYWRSGIDLLRNRILCTLFFQPSTRTRFSHETAMFRLGGNVLTESNPLISSSAAILVAVKHRPQSKARRLWIGSIIMTLI